MYISFADPPELLNGYRNQSHTCILVGCFGIDEDVFLLMVNKYLVLARCHVMKLTISVEIKFFERGGNINNT